jgi:ABC-2 type transport system ATP-binding protein
MVSRALMHAPKVLFLDEPSTGLDPAARLFLWDRLQELRDAGVTLVLTTHDMDEAATLADRVGIMDHGKLLALDTPEVLMRSVPGGTTLELTAQIGDPARAEAIIAGLSALREVERVERLDNVPVSPESGDGTQAHRSTQLRLRLYVLGDAPLLVAPAAAVLAEQGATLSDVKLGSPTLEDVFIDLTGRALR